MEAAPPPSSNSHATRRRTMRTGTIPPSQRQGRPPPRIRSSRATSHAYLARLRTSNPRVERVGLVLYLPAGRGLVPPAARRPCPIPIVLRPCPAVCTCGEVGEEGVEREDGGEGDGGEGEVAEASDPPPPRARRGARVLPRAPRGTRPRRAGVLPAERGAGLCRVLAEGAGADGGAVWARFGPRVGAGCGGGVDEGWGWGWNTAGRDWDAEAEAEAEAEVERREVWAAELRARDLDELREERERGDGTGGG
ncbi:hypothetical protein B0H14DRAFT_3762172 [Mycena olivaceomarginata]|nr:hypothetical protein B0H14DRAFT_3762172 [Mycena olivaceomarginata]